eukprot:3941979-Rhodomonas_salina.3
MLCQIRTWNSGWVEGGFWKGKPDTDLRWGGQVSIGYGVPGAWGRNRGIAKEALSVPDIL